MDLSDASSLISDLVGEANEILGAHLANLLRQRCPGLDIRSFGSPTLSSFIANHVRNVYVAGRSGMDYIYKKAPQSDGDEAIAAVNFWRAWVSPNGRYVLWIDRSSGKVSALPRNASVPAGSLRLDPPAVQAHQQVAREFLDRFEVDPEGKIAALIIPDKQNWWQAWYAALRKAGLAQRWNAFRRKRMQEILLQDMAKLPLSEDLRNLAFENIRSSDVAQTRADDGGLSAVTDGLIQARSIAIKAIEQMSEQELRELRLPFGIVLDVMRNKG